MPLLGGHAYQAFGKRTFSQWLLIANYGFAVRRVRYLD
jgi:hypothetical protein